METYTLFQSRSNDYTYHNQQSLNRLLIIAVITIALAYCLNSLGAVGLIAAITAIHVFYVWKLKD